MYLFTWHITQNKIIAGVVALVVLAAVAGFYFYRRSRAGTGTS